MEKIKQVIVLRKDLGMRKGKMVAQGAHASMKVFFDLMSRDVGGQYTLRLHEVMVKWVEGLFTKVVLGVDSEEDLLNLYNKAKKQRCVLWVWFKD